MTIVAVSSSILLR